MAGTNIKGGMAYIRGRDAEHVHVLRMRPGEDMTICDGQGTDYKCRLVKADKEEVEAEVLEVRRCPAEPSVRVTVLCGLPKGDRTDYIIQKSVEAGAQEILFFNAKRCVAKPDPGEFVDVLNIALQKDLALFMYETGEREPLNAVLEANRDVGTAAIITGPEGGFAEFEADLARVTGLHVCSMGERILRCETAPVVALTALMYATGNLS